MILNDTNVRDILIDCLYTQEEREHKTVEELTSEAVIVEGVVNTFGFHPQRLESHRGDVVALLSQINPEFAENSESRGLSFIELGVRHPDGVLWGEHRNMQELMCLAIGLGLMKILQPRKLWVLTHGVPMLSVSPEVFNDIHDNPEFFKIERP